MMETYQTLPIKYRPTKISELVGQESAKRTLTNMLKTGKIARTIFIHGPWGCGKTTVARLIARYLNCEELKENEPCGICFSCKGMDASPPNHPDLVEINAADTRGIDTIRELKESAYFSPRTKYRVYILDECHQITSQAFQALLKITEEPPKHSVFILCTTEPGKVPNAIKSRALTIPIVPVQDSAMTKHLLRISKQEGIKLKDTVIDRIVTSCKGHVRDALSILEKLSFVVQDEETSEVVIEEIIEEVLRVEPENIATRILLSIYSGKYTSAAKLLRGIDNHVTVLEEMLNLHSVAVDHALTDKLDDRAYDLYYQSLDKLQNVGIRSLVKSNSLSICDLSKMMQHIVEATTAAKNYTINGYYLMESLLLNCLSITKKLEKEKP